MPSIGDLKKLRQAYSATADVSADEVLRQIGDPPDEAIIDFAHALMSHADRNLRVLALRVLEHYRSDRALQGVLLGLRDEKRRVCAAAIQACPNYLGHVAVAERLEEIVRDTAVKRKLRRRALSMLAGNDGRWQGDLTIAAAAALHRLLAEREHRFAILFGLVRLEAAPRIVSSISVFAASADENERRMARRALRGERVIHINRYAADIAMQQRIMQTCDIAHGRMYYWLPPDDFMLRRAIQ
jgi:hypothetical protein